MRRTTSTTVEAYYEYNGGGGRAGPTTVEGRAEGYLRKLRRMSYKSDRFEDVLSDNFLANNGPIPFAHMGRPCRAEVDRPPRTGLRLQELYRMPRPAYSIAERWSAPAEWVLFVLKPLHFFFYN